MEVVTTANGGINVRLWPDLSGGTSQSGYGSLYASIYPSHVGIDRMKAELLVAFTTGAHVALWLSDSMCTLGELCLTQ